MIYFIKGTVEETGKDFIVIDNGGIGYKVFVSPSTLSRLGTHKPTKIFTYYHVREDNISLYGFLSKEELDMFELLISVSGIGPKAGLAILSAMTPSKLGLSIIGGDIKSLTKVPGIGSKTAHRIILELKDKIDSNGFLGVDDKHLDTENDSIREAVDALMTLGYNESEAVSAITRVEAETKDTESIIKQALKILMK